MVIELVTLRVREGATESSVLAAVECSTEFLARQPGFLGREVAVTAEGEYADIVRWSSREAADSATAKFNDAPETRDFNTLIVGETVRVSHFHSLYTK